jgi:hypothetical protein
VKTTGEGALKLETPPWTMLPPQSLGKATKKDGSKILCKVC